MSSKLNVYIIYINHLQFNIGSLLFD